MKQVILEVCCGSADDVIQAHRAGAHRVELNSNLFHGGLTPTIGSLLTAKKATGMKIMTMVRPREGGFCYTQVTDVQQEINGLMDMDRNFKIEPEVIKEINERKIGYWRSFM